MKLDSRRAARIAKRLHEAGDTPASELIEQLLEERAKLLGVVPPGTLPADLVLAGTAVLENPCCADPDCCDQQRAHETALVGLRAALMKGELS